ncbi:LysR family transcriptional regulator [Dactylosporangium sp. CA-092794]|uniref:LysR family transcriptional regulator n=1 Tax=Dactylosporangium sp. CA-092794 TaxID=3239929 RepID=UPI003D932250
MDLRTLRYFVAVAEELHFGRAAARLHMTQPPLSRAVKGLETDLGAVLLHRSPSGVELTPAGAALLAEARTLLAQADRLRARVSAASGPATLTIGTLGDAADQTGTRLAAGFRDRHPGVDVHIREADFADPTTGLRTGLADVALTRAPFDDTGIATVPLRADPVGVVLRADDPLASAPELRLADLAGRRWFRFPDGTDPLWSAYWRATPDGDGPVVRTAHECRQAVLWTGTVGLTPLGHALPAGLVAVPLPEMPPSRLVVAWNTAAAGPLVHSFARLAAALYRG